MTTTEGGTPRAHWRLVMLSRAGLLLALAASVASFVVACDPGGTTQADPQDIEEVDEDCRTCLVDLAECASTAHTAEQFVECRDLFATCQDDASLDADECGNPGSKLACGLCQDRLGTCDEDEEGGDCDEEFDSCRDLLIRGPAAIGCEPREEEEPQATCDDCLRQLATCASADEASVCQNGFAQCRDLNGLAECGNPTDAQVCELCDAQAETCEAQEEEAACAESRAACVGQLASDPAACPVEEGGEGGGSGEGGSAGTGEGGSAGTGEGGSTGSGEGGSASTGETTGGGTCEHDGCSEGDAPDAECNACTAEVCETDSYCCDGAWDATCVELAGISDSCGCSADTCAHDVCESGDALDATCSECATAVCALDDFCCTIGWDTTCTELAATECGCSI